MDDVCVGKMNEQGMSICSYLARVLNSVIIVAYSSPCFHCQKFIRPVHWIVIRNTYDQCFLGVSCEMIARLETLDYDMQG